MKKVFIGILSICSLSAALSENIGWNIQRVPDHISATAVGYMYETYATGTQSGIVGSTAKKNTTALRLICSVTVDKPLVAIYWNTMTGDTPQYVTIRADKKTPGQSFHWEQDGPLLIRTVTESIDIIKTLKISKTVRFSWSNPANNTLYTTIFDLRDFNAHLAEFNTYCNTKL